MPALRIKPSYTVDATGNREAVSALGPCRWIRVRQLPTEAGADYYVSDSITGGSRAYKTNGEDHIFTNNTGLFQTGEVAGYVEAVSGSFTMEQEEGT